MLVLGMTAALADNPGAITVTDQKKPAGTNTTVTYEVYRIFDVAAAEDGNGGYLMDGNKYASMTYTIASKWAGFFASGAAGANYIVTDNDMTANNGKGYTPIVVNGVVKYINLTSDNIATFAKAALAYSQTTPVANDGENTEGTFTNLPLGYYMVYPKGANLNVDGYSSIVSLTTTDPTVEVVQKAEYPTLEKVDDDASVEIGQTVNYTLTSKVPDTTGFTTFDFNMHDQMTDGLTFDGADHITVTIGSGDTAVTVPKTSVDGKNYTFAAETPGDGFETAFKISIPVMKYQDHVGETITVTYTATVNDKAVVNIEKNHAWLEYSNNPKNDQEHTTTPPDEEDVFSAKIIIDKYDATNTEAKLAGAKFVLRCKSVTETQTAATKPTAQAGKYYQLTGTGTTADPYVAHWVSETAVDAKVTANQAALVSDVSTNGATIVETDENGAAEFKGLENGVYELIEVKAPDGYNPIKGVAAEITVNGNNTTTTSLSYTQPVGNNSGTELPSTGGIGTTLFYVGGGILVLLAVVMLVTKRRMSGND